MLLDIADHQLHFEIVGVLLGDFVQPVKNRLQPRQFSHMLDLPGPDFSAHLKDSGSQRPRCYPTLRCWHFFPNLTIALDATPLTVSTGGVARYTLELARALARRFPEDEYWLLSDQPFSVPELPANLHRGDRPAHGGGAQMVAVGSATGNGAPPAWNCFTAPIFPFLICLSGPA